MQIVKGNKITCERNVKRVKNVSFQVWTNISQQGKITLKILILNTSRFFQWIVWEAELIDNILILWIFQRGL